MAHVIQCDWCKTVAAPERAQAYWLSVVWHTPDSVQQSPLDQLFGARQPQPEQRTFCTVACLGMWAQTGEAVQGATHA